MSDSKSSYRQIMKATSIFGGVQLFSIIIQIIRSKAIAFLLGPSGIGIMGLFTSTLAFIETATNFGLQTSAVRDISNANENNNKVHLEKTIAAFNKLVWLTGILGTVITIIFAPYLSILTFGSNEYQYEFMTLAFIILVNQQAAGRLVILQGLRKIKWLAKANVFGSTVGVFLTIPLFYFFGKKGIVPALIISSILTLIIHHLYTKKVNIKKQHITLTESLIIGKHMLKLGFMLSMSSIITLGASYGLKIFISNQGDVAQVGLYTAGFTILNVYVGLVFKAISTDYFPRLSAISHNKLKTNELINQQIEIAILILAPMIAFFLIFIDWVIIFLYSEKFTPISSMIHWAIIGILFKAVSWPIAFLILAKGNSKIFFWNELMFNLYFFTFNIIGYKYFGFQGLGISFIMTYFLYAIQVLLITNKLYNFKLTKNFLSFFCINLLFGIIGLSIQHFFTGSILYILGIILILVTSTFSLYTLNKKLSIVNFFKK